MPYNLCSRCREPWNTTTLTQESISVFLSTEIDQLMPLNALSEDVWAGFPADTRASALALLAPLAAPEELVTAAFAFWWSDDRPDHDCIKTAARHFVGTAIRLAFERGLGCPDCGFDHTAPHVHGIASERTS